MLKIRMKTLDAGPNGVRQIGHEYEVDDAEANELIQGSYAELVEAAQASETKVNGDELPTLDEFVEMTAPGQKKLLEVLQIEGDDSNAEKRLALYGTYLEGNGVGGDE